MVLGSINRRTFTAGIVATASGTLFPLHLRAATPPKDNFETIGSAIVVRTTENVTRGAWVPLLNAARKAGVRRIYLLIKQDENNYQSEATGRKLRSGEMLAPIADGSVAVGWANPEWLYEMLALGKNLEIEIHAWWPCFQDAVAADVLPEARYAGDKHDVFLDPAFQDVGFYQAKRIQSLLDTYPFDGVALDWLRYNNRPDGSTGPLAEEFRNLTGEDWSKELMTEPFAQAMWDDLRARRIASWTQDLLAESRARHPTVAWSSFVLPWTFKEVAQSYRHLSAAGLDSLQPMIYWRDWNEAPTFTSEVIRPAPFQLSGRTTIDPTFDVTEQIEDLSSALDLLPRDRLGQLVWYQHHVWTPSDFQKITQLGKRMTARWRKLDAAAQFPLVSIPPTARLTPAKFSADASVWSVVCLGELYRRRPPSGTDTVIPVLAMHRFSDGSLESGPSDWHISTAYLDALIALISDQFDAVPVETLAAFMTSEDRRMMPSRGLVITIDDGSATVATHFEPRSAKADIPYAIGLITSWVDEDEGRDVDMGDGLSDRILSWHDIGKLDATGRASFVSHTHDQHRYGIASADGNETGPAVTTRLWIEAENRLESEEERLRRVFLDLAASRAALMSHGVGPSTLLIWPYGESDSATEAEARDAGFTHFFEFGPSGFAAPRRIPQRIMRITVMRADEAVPLTFPSDPIVAQRWWLAFQAWARRSQSIELVERAIAQLDNDQQSHPEALISKAAVHVLQGYADEARRQLTALRNLYPHDRAIHTAIDDFEADYSDLV